MGGNKSDKLKDQSLQAINQQNQAAAQTQIAQNKPTPVEDYLNNRDLEWLKATDNSQPLDVTKLPGMSPYFAMYQRAANNQQAQRTGLGSLRMGAENADPNLAETQARADQLRREQDAGGELEQAYGLEDANVTGSALPLIQANESRNATNIGATSNMADTSLGDWAHFQVRPSFWQQFALAGMQGASNVAAAYYTG